MYWTPRNPAVVLASHTCWETLQMFDSRIMQFRILKALGTPLWMEKERLREGDGFGQRHCQLAAGQGQGQVWGLSDQSPSQGEFPPPLDHQLIISSSQGHRVTRTGCFPHWPEDQQSPETASPSTPPTDIMAECEEEEPGATGEIHSSVLVHGSGDLASGCGLIFPILLTDITPEDRTVHTARQARRKSPWIT